MSLIDVQNGAGMLPFPCTNQSLHSSPALIRFMYSVCSQGLCTPVRRTLSLGPNASAELDFPGFPLYRPESPLTCSIHPQRRNPPRVSQPISLRTTLSATVLLHQLRIIAYLHHKPLPSTFPARPLKDLRHGTHFSTRIPNPEPLHHRNQCPDQGVVFLRRSQPSPETRRSYLYVGAISRATPVDFHYLPARAELNK